MVTKTVTDAWFLGVVNRVLLLLLASDWTVHHMSA